MRPEEIRSRGTTLMTRTQRELDTTRRLEMMLGSHRRRRVFTAAVAAALLIVVAGALLLTNQPDAPVATSPETTITTALGIAPDDPQALASELARLRESARPGTLVGFVHLGEASSTGQADSPAQPVCEGAGSAEVAHPGQSVFVTDSSGNVVGQGTLTGSSYAFGFACQLWFEIGVPSDLTLYRVQIGGLAPVEVANSVLDQVEWILDMWDPPDLAATSCLGLDDQKPQTCLPIQGAR